MNDVMIAIIFTIGFLTVISVVEALMFWIDLYVEKLQGKIKNTLIGFQ